MDGRTQWAVVVTAVDDGEVSCFVASEHAAQGAAEAHAEVVRAANAGAGWQVDVCTQEEAAAVVTE